MFSLRKTASLLVLAGGAVLLSGPALAADIGEGDFGGTYAYIGPGVASLDPVYEEVVPVYPAPPPIAYAAPVYEGPPAVVVEPPDAAYEYFGPGEPGMFVTPDVALPVGID
jgi:hypothetical protein